MRSASQSVVYSRRGPATQSESSDHSRMTHHHTLPPPGGWRMCSAASGCPAKRPTSRGAKSGHRTGYFFSSPFFPVHTSTQPWEIIYHVSTASATIAQSQLTSSDAADAERWTISQRDSISISTNDSSPLKPAELQVLRSQYEKEGDYVSVQTKFNYAWVCPPWRPLYPWRDL